MKKFLSVILCMVLMMSVLGISAFASDEEEFYLFDSEGISYFAYDDVAFISGYDSEEAGEELVIPDTVKNEGKTFRVVGISSGAFSGAPYKTVTIGKNVTTIGDAAFEAAANLEKVNIPAETEFIYFGAYVFFGTLVEGEFFSQDVTILGKNVLFSYCGSDKEYTIPEDIDIIVSGCFMYSGIEKVNFNSSVTEIPELAFAGCRQLKDFTIPDTIETIGTGAFKDCTSLENIDLGDGVATVYERAFENSALKSVRIGKNASFIDGAFALCYNLTEITVDPENTSFEVNETGLFEIDSLAYLPDEEGNETETRGRALIYIFPEKATGDLVLSDDITAINAYVFYNNKNIKTVTAKGVINIRYKAFANSSVEKFIGGEDLFDVYDGAFLNCRNLSEIDLRATSYIGTSAFENCTSLTQVEFSQMLWAIGPLAFSNTGLTEVEIYGDYSGIEESAFKGCQNLKTVVFGDGVAYLGCYLFTNCPNLETIYLSKTIEYIDENAFAECDNVKFLLIRGSDAYYFVRALDFEYEIVGRITLFERIADFLKDVFNFLFGWLPW